MRKSIMLFAALLFLAAATSAPAVQDPDPDQMGVYFDLGADVVCTTAAPVSHVYAYLIYTNPSLAAIRGFECQVRYEAGDMNTSIISTLALPGQDVGVKIAPVFNFIVGYGGVLTTSTTTILATLDIFYLNFSGSPMRLFLGPADPSSSLNGLPMIFRDDFSMMDVGVSGEGGFVAIINGPCDDVVPDEKLSFGAIKALFR